MPSSSSIIEFAAFRFYYYAINIAQNTRRCNRYGRGNSVRISAPLCKVRSEGLWSESRLPCVRGAGTAIKDLNAVTEGLYLRPVTAFALFNIYPALL